MIKPTLTIFNDFIDKPKPIIMKSPKQLQENVNWYLNIIIFLVIVIGLVYLYQRYKYKIEHEKEIKDRLTKFDNYLNDYYINDMINQSKKYT